jgi:protein SFI1
MNLLLRNSLARWRSRTSARTKALQRGVTFSNNHLLKATFYSWKIRLKEKRKNVWRNDMRSRMKIVQERQEGILLKETWVKWRQSYHSHLSEQHYAQRLLTRVYRNWQNRLYEVDHLENTADEFRHRVEESSARKCWEFWKKVTEVRSAEKIISERVGLRIMNEVLDVWKSRL